MNCFIAFALLFVGTVAPIPYPHRYLNDYKISNPVVENQSLQTFQNAETISKYENINQQSNFNLRDPYIPRSLPAYMSPVPTHRDSRFISETEENTRLPRHVFTPMLEPLISIPPILNEREATNPVLNEDQKTSQFQIASELLRGSSYANPSSTVNNKEIMGGLLNHRRPISLNQDLSQQEERSTSKEILTQNRLILKKLAEISQNVNEREIKNTFAQPVSVNERQETNYNTLPNTFSRFNRVPATIQENPPFKTVQEPFLIATPVRETYRPTINVRREQAQIPLIDAERIASITPIDIEQRNSKEVVINNRGQQIYRPVLNEQSGVASQKYNVEQLMASQRVKDVLSSTKHKKRYLVIHPDGRVEHVDHLESIAKNHPNYVLVNAGHIVAKNNVEVKPENTEPQMLTPASTSKPFSEKLLVNSEPQSSTPKENASEPEGSPEVKEVSTEAVIKADTEPAIITSSSPKSEPVITTSPSPVSVSTPKDILETTSIPPPVEILDIKNTVVSQPPESVPDCTTSEETSKPELVDAPASILATEIPTTDVAATETSNDSKVVEAETVAPVVQNIVTKSKELAEKSQVEVSDVVAENPLGKPTWFNTSDPGFWDKLTDGKEDNIIYFFQVKSRPRVEKDVQRTIFPDGTIIEELTESVWYNENDEAPIVTKTTRVLHPEDL